jgi:hypothetical protein
MLGGPLVGMRLTDATLNSDIEGSHAVSGEDQDAIVVLQHTQKY